MPSLSESNKPSGSEESPVTDHFTFRFDATSSFDSPSRAIENEDLKFLGEYGVDVFETGPVNVLQVWLFDMFDIRITTAHLIADPSKMALAQSMLNELDQIVLAANSQGFEIDSTTLHLTGHIVDVLLQPDGSFAKVTIEVEVTTKPPQPTSK